MLDATLRPLIDRPLTAAGRELARRGVSATMITGGGLVAGVLTAAAIALEAHWVGFLLILFNRLLDGLDGAVARATQPTDVGGYLDIAVDYVFYAGVPLAFALSDPSQNALPAAALLAGFCLTCSSFLAFAVMAAKRGLATESRGRKSFFYSNGLVEGTETILFFLIMAAVPEWFAPLAWLFAGLCVLTAIQRAAAAIHAFR